MSRLTTTVALSRLRGWAALAFTAALISACAGGADVHGDTAADQTSVLSGELVYRQRIAMAPDAQISVRLVDVDDGRVLGKQEIQPDGKQVPIAFQIEYEQRAAANDHSHVLLASVRDGSGQLHWAANEPVDLAHAGRDDDLRVRLAQAHFNDQALMDTRWQLQYIEQADGTLAWSHAERPSSIEFGSDGRVAGRAACNSFFADYELAGDDQLRMGQAGATLMACPESGLAQPFLQTLSQVKNYVLTGDALRLIADDATLVLTQSAASKTSAQADTADTQGN